MRALIQRVNSSKVYINKKEYSSIKHGMLILLGITQNDSVDKIKKLVNKIINLRIFPSNDKNMDQSVIDINGSILVVSQFTLYGNCEKGRRPSFVNAEQPDRAKILYEKFIREIESKNINVKQGKFGSEMQIHIENNGPVTLMLEL